MSLTQIPWQLEIEAIKSDCGIETQWDQFLSEPSKLKTKSTLRQWKEEAADENLACLLEGTTWNSGATKDTIPLTLPQSTGQLDKMYLLAARSNYLFNRSVTKCNLCGISSACKTGHILINCEKFSVIRKNILDEYPF
jgi:hypothetical protein